MIDVNQYLFMVQNAAEAAQEALADEHEGNFTFYIHHLFNLTSQLKDLVEKW